MATTLTHDPLAFATLDRDALDPCIVTRAEAHHVWIVLERVVNDSAVVRVHRLELHRTSGNAHRVGDLADPVAQPVIAHRTPMRDVDLNLRGVPILRLQD